MPVSRETTSFTLLKGLRERDTKQWDRFAKLYAPLVYEWCRRARVPKSDSADIVQEVFVAVSAKIDTFRRDRIGDTFRGWLWGIARHKINDHFRQLAKRPVPEGGTTAQMRINQVPLELPEEYDEAQVNDDNRLIYHRAVEMLRTDFQEKTWQAFWNVAINEEAAVSVAQELEMTVGAVYNARYKVLRRLRSEFDGLV